MKWAHSSFHDLVLAHGRVFEPAPLPEDIYPALPGHCFKAATILADQHALTYVEGLVLPPDTRTVTEGGRWSVLTADQDGGSAQNLELLQHGLPATGILEIGKPPGGLARATDAQPTAPYQSDAGAPSTSATTRADRGFPSLAPENAPRAGRHRENRDALFVAADVRPKAAVR